MGKLGLDNGQVLKVWGNDGGCSCSAGCYPLQHVASTDNIITDVVVTEPPTNRYGAVHGHYTVFGFTIDSRIAVAEFEGTDGNGYYGTGFHVEVSE